MRSRFKVFGRRFRAGKRGSELARLVSALGSGPKPWAYPATGCYVNHDLCFEPQALGLSFGRGQ